LAVKTKNKNTNEFRVYYGMDKLVGNGRKNNSYVKGIYSIMHDVLRNVHIIAQRERKGSPH